MGNKWIILVWIVSTICYLPLGFERSGYAVPNVLIQMKYLFVLVPIIFSLIYVRRRTKIRQWLGSLLIQKIKIESLMLCGAIAVFGILCTSILDENAWNGISVPFSTLYLLGMAALEEIAWRGFYLESVLQTKTERAAVLTVSLHWAVWHIPMWLIRNSIGVNEIVIWAIYTVLVGNILGKCVIKYENILVPIILHTIFNVCFLMPIMMNAMGALCIWIGILSFEKIKRRRV